MLRLAGYASVELHQSETGFSQLLAPLWHIQVLPNGSVVDPGCVAVDTPAAIEQVRRYLFRHTVL